MGPANKNKNDSGSSWRSGEEKEKIQAIIIADSFNRKFTPITQETPRVRNSTLTLTWDIRYRYIYI